VAVVENFQPDAAVANPKIDIDGVRAGVVERVLRRFLGDSVQMIARLELDVKGRFAFERKRTGVPLNELR
jgi:hypothetical protein